MLETIHLTKVYKTKGGADVRALDDVSIRFPETGMVFLLGKSGSGKSTLLNVCGGLDVPTAGAISVKGKISTAFRQSDFDSYRNTYVGFIFQEYNILEEFTVEDNIALALELQGKTKDKDRIEELLAQVDLSGYAKRKPNTLSGGQKQRIAIARALVKSPEIIMADEPTGALDSETGRQVFDTLKKLSKDKLVIVVSHDRDFAESYADRIIELKDGRILSDVTKTHEGARDINTNLRIVGETLCVRNGAELTEEDFTEIKEFLKKTPHDVVIASGEQQVKEYKENNHIRENGLEVFRCSDEVAVESKEYLPQETRFIRSKLPARHAFRIGVSGLRTKPVRLLCTVFLCTVAFIFFGLLSTMTFYNKETTFKASLTDADEEMMQLKKIYQIREVWYYEGELQGDFTIDEQTFFTEEERQKLAETYGKEAFGAIEPYLNFIVQNRSAKYWSTQIKSLAYLDEENLLRERIIGRYPVQEGEICISSYTAEVICQCKILEEETQKVLDLEKPEDVLGKKITLSGTEYTIVGIMQTGAPPEKYEPLKDMECNDFALYSGLINELEDGLYQVGFVSEGEYKEIAKSLTSDYAMSEFDMKQMASAMRLGTEEAYKYPEYWNAGYAGFGTYAPQATVVSFEEGRTSPREDEVYVTPALFLRLLTYMPEPKEENASLYGELMEAAMFLMDETTEESAVQKIADILKEAGKTPELSMKFFDDYEGRILGEPRMFQVAGIWYRGQTDENGALFEDETAQKLWALQREQVAGYSEYSTNYVKSADALYETIYVPYNHSEEQTDQLWEIYANDEYGADDSRMVLSSMLISNLEMVDILVEALSKVFLYAGIVLAVFAALLLSNFISISISYKKREIGILRAVGARSIDVFKIFFSESFVITAVCVVISVLGSVAVCSAINSILVDLIDASLFVFGTTSLGVLLAIAMVTAVTATFLPVWNAAKKKPVESIRAL